MDNGILVEGVSKAYRGTPVLEKLDLAVPRGSVTALLGANGAGKTTLLGILSTLLRPDAGRAAVDGHDVVREAASVRRSISVTGQSAAVDEVLTGTENLRMMARLLGLGRRAAADRAAELVARFALTEAAGKAVRTYSGGMRRRLDIAMGLLGNPSVVFLDEPTTGLDTRSRAEVWAAITELAGGGATVLVTTQYLEEADRLADTVAVLARGRIVALGAPAELKARVGTEVLATTTPAGEAGPEAPTDGTLAGCAARPPSSTLPTEASSPSGVPPSTTCSSPSPTPPLPLLRHPTRSSSHDRCPRPAG